MNKNFILNLAIFISMFCLGHAQAQLTAAQKEQIGFTALQNRLGLEMPTGLGLSATMVEAPDGSGYYRANTANAQLTGKTFVFPSGGATGTSSHATTVARYLVGSQSLAPDLGASSASQSIANYEVNNWLGTGFLRPAQNQLPLVENRDIQNHSWIGTTGNNTTDQEYIRRFDYAVRRDNFVATIGLNNLSSTVVPNLMASAYNGIVVGRSDGQHSTGTTNLDGSGRTVPHLVVPTSTTSYAAPTVGSASALLIETARKDVALANGDRAQVVKSLLMAGASRSGDNVTFSWTSNAVNNLDSHYGAGQLNIENSYDILTAGRFAKSNSTSVAETGWDFNSVSSANPNQYFFDFSGGELTASLNWYREVTATLSGGGPNQTYTWGSSLANLDLRLYSADGFVLNSLILSSLSAVDNTEFLYASILNPGRYAFEVTSNQNNIDYSLAWIAVIPELGTIWMMAIMGMGLLVVRFARKKR